MDQQLPYTAGFVPFNPFDARQLVQGGVSRSLGWIFSSDFVPWQFHKNGDLSDFEPDLYKGQTWVKSLQIVQTGKDNFKPLGGAVDESYNFTLSEDGAAKLTAVSSTGVLRGLETFSQLFYKHSAGPFWYTPYAPIAIQDAPKYPHRGILLDVARNWYPVKDILRTIDAMSWSKMNRIHIHITDSQSWPLEIPSIPELAKKGAYRPDLTYSANDIKMIQEYAIHRGIEPIIEIDMPGHIGSVAKSHPELITAYDAFPYFWWCAEPPCGAFKLNDTGVDKFLGTVFDDLFPRLAPYTAYFHTGGDELNANDSMLDPGVKSNATDVLQPLLQKFIDNQHARVRKHGLTPMVWEEIPLDWNVTLGKDVVVQTWLGASSVKTLTSKGQQVIDSDYTYWVSESIPAAECQHGGVN
jgi:hexosaminidase